MPVTPQLVQEALDKDPEISVVYLTSPNMEGLVADYAAIRQVCEPNNILLIVDEAHGAHFYFNENMPVGALKSGADATVCSVHKTLGALSASALINVAKNSRLSASKVKDSYHLLNTTSPSPLLLADVESCVRTLSGDGSLIIDRAIHLSKKLRDSISKLPAVTIGTFHGSFKSDPTKSIIKIRGLTGHEFSDILDTMRINIEKSTQKCIVVTSHINISEEDVDQLITAIEQIAREYGVTEEEDALARGCEDSSDVNPIYKKILINRRFKLDVREVLAAESEELTAKEAVGRISAEIKYKCPPGFPVLVYGEEILPEHLELFGPLEKLKVMKLDNSSL
jgi:arginine decarboxylase